MTPSKFRWGMILIQVGILLLMQNHDIISDVGWEALFVLFPVVLIAVGIEKIFTKTKLQFISYLTTLLLFFGGFAIALTASNINGHDTGFFSDSVYKEEMNPKVNLIKATMNLEQSNLNIRDSGPELILAEFDEFTRKPEIESYIEDDVAFINFQALENSYFGGAVKIKNDEVQDWTIRFSEDLPIELECFGFDNDLHLSFLTSRLRKLKLDTENSSIRLNIGTSEPYVQIFIVGDESKLRLRVPEKSGVKIFSDDSTYFFKLGFSETEDGSFINDIYNTADMKIDLEIDNNLNSFSLDYF